MLTEADGQGRRDAVERAVKLWTGQLVDLTARNNLLYFRDLKVGTLDLGAVPTRLLFDVLAGKTVAISRLFPDEEARKDAVRRARAVRNRAQEHFEERGLETLYLACGLATWTNPRTAATPRAPVLLVPARLAPRGAAQDDFEVSITGDLEVNPTLLAMLQSEFDVACDPEELMVAAGMEGAIDTQEELDIAYRWLSDHAASVPGFAVESRLVLGTFSYAKLPMVNDLEGAVEAILEHDLISALAGDEAARAAVRERHATEVQPTDPNHIPPPDEFLVLDADASQNYGINAVLAGQDLIVKGPPGTGKSQTIANLISTLVARGKSVLFVAEKRAAIDAVLRRLQAVGLGDLVLDMHGGVGSRRQVAQSLAASLETNATIALGDHRRDHQLLQARREELNSVVAALHHPRSPWDLSLFEVQVRLLGLDDAFGTHVRFRGEALRILTGDVYEQAREDLQTFADLGGLRLPSSGSPWRNATVVSSEEAQAAQRLVDQLRHHTMPAALGSLRAAAGLVGLTAPSAVSGWADHLSLWERLESTLELFEPELFADALDDLERTLAPLGAGAGKRASATLTSGEYRAARKTLKARLCDGARPRPAELFAALTEAHELVGHWRALAHNGSAPHVPENLSDLRGGYTELQAELEQLSCLLGMPVLDGSEDEVRAALDALAADTQTLGRLPELHRLQTALSRVGLDALVGDAVARGMGTHAAASALEHAWLWSIADHVRLTDPTIASFDGERHSRTVAEFQAADQRHVRTTAQRVRRLAAERATRAQDEHPEQGTLIQDQAARKRGHLSFRQLFSGAPDVMTALKPCWAMSPLIVSQLLPPDRQYFDVVVFDEASQVRPADAIPAILRGKRVVVAGDERQLPPTDFFTGATADDAATMEGRIVVDAGFESILEALLPFLRFRMLSWHYRSQDERLIAFSNVHLYDRGMTTFPGVAGSECLGHSLVPFAPGEVGSDVSMAGEVERVVELILDHAMTRPTESLGVIAMGIKHADRIDETLRRELSGRTDLEDFFDEGREERFFIKNLERVQGDERDAIILTIGYGKNADGRLMYRFGPLNQEGGERRLNVAITRAKRRLALVSSFGFDDMEPGRSAARGVELMRLYLQFAASHGENLGPEALAIPELNAFEVDVRDALTRAGIPLTPQYGASGFRIDFAAQHPHRPGRMILAIECDGASYHSSETARDRDRLRQEHLERLGWTFHRIWSQDWFANRDREVEKVVAAYRAAIERAEDRSGGAREAEASAPVEDGDASVRTRDLRPAIPRYDDITQYSQAQLRALVRWIESDTLLRTNDQLLTAAIFELGFKKRGHRIVSAVNAAIAAERR
jgi:very-short-patch-repair endonuclease